MQVASPRLLIHYQRRHGTGRVLGGMAELTKEQREFIVRKLAAFYTPRDIAVQLSALFGLRCNENDVTANDPTLNVVDPDLFMLFRSEREKVLCDPSSDPYTNQKARLILLSIMVDRYKNNNQLAEARSVMQQIASEMGIGAKGVGKAAPLPAEAAAEIVAITRKIVHPVKHDEPAE